MRKKNFKLKVLEEGRLGNDDLSEIYGGDVNRPCESKYLICSSTTFDQPCLSYTTCNGFLPDGNPSFLYCTNSFFKTCSLEYEYQCKFNW